MSLKEKNVETLKGSRVEQRFSRKAVRETRVKKRQLSSDEETESDQEYGGGKKQAVAAVFGAAYLKITAPMAQPPDQCAAVDDVRARLEPWNS